MRVVFEGLPGAGKTKLTQYLAEKFGFPAIPEFSCVDEKDWRKYKFTKPFYQVNDEAKEFLGNLFSERFVFFDRHYASTLAYSYALSACFGPDPITGESYLVNYRWYQKCICEKKLTQPDFVFLIEISPTTSLKRKPLAGAIDYVWRNETSLSMVQAYYHQFYQLIEPNVNVIQVNGENTEDEVRNLVEQHVIKLMNDKYYGS